MSRARADPASLPALKERAGVVAALADGRQTVLLRDPDLPPAESDGPFVLYPSYTHQDPDRYDPRDLRYYHRSKGKPEGGIPLRAVATVAAERTVPAADLGALAPHYVYTPAGIREKYGLDWDASARLLVLRVSRLADPRLVEERPAYRGCRTWIDLDGSVSVDPGDATPVLDDAAFAERRAALRDALD